MTTSTSAMSSIPTAAFSPDNDWIARDDYVLYVDLDGSLGDVYGVERSYGSPHFNDIAYSYYVHLVGYIDVSISVHNSYGK